MAIKNPINPGFEQSYDQKMADLEDNLKYYSKVTYNKPMLENTRKEMSELVSSLKSKKPAKKAVKQEVKVVLETKPEPAKKKVKKDYSYYEAKTVVELKKIAKKLGIPKYYDKNERPLIMSIMAKNK